jgi:hypothetical protein
MMKQRRVYRSDLRFFLLLLRTTLPFSYSKTVEFAKASVSRLKSSLAGVAAREDSATKKIAAKQP